MTRPLCGYSLLRRLRDEESTAAGWDLLQTHEQITGDLEPRDRKLSSKPESPLLSLRSLESAAAQLMYSEDIRLSATREATSRCIRGGLEQLGTPVANIRDEHPGPGPTQEHVQISGSIHA